MLKKSGHFPDFMSEVLIHHYVTQALLVAGHLGVRLRCTASHLSSAITRLKSASILSVLNPLGHFPTRKALPRLEGRSLHLLYLLYIFFVDIQYLFYES